MRRLPACLAVLLLELAALTSAHADQTRMSFGYDVSTGGYGDTTPTDIRASFLQASHQQGDYTYKLILPYIKVVGPAGVIGRGDAVLNIPEALDGRAHSEGLGDLVASVTHTRQGYWDAAKASASVDNYWALDLTGKLKIPTADRERGLGSGKYDVAIVLDAYRGWGKNTLMLGAGYKWLGQPSGMDYRNVASAMLGIGRRLSKQTEAGLLLDIRQSAQGTQPDQRELTAYLSHRLSGHHRVQFYLYGGTTSASPDLGGGGAIGYEF